MCDDVADAKQRQSAKNKRKQNFRKPRKVYTAKPLDNGSRAGEALRQVQGKPQAVWHFKLQVERCAEGAAIAKKRNGRRQPPGQWRLAKHRAQNKKTKAEQRKSASENGYTYNKHRDQLCKGPDQLVEGSTGSTCTKSQFSAAFK
jgi:uncharacterized protein YcgL (UPF0745 family)